MKTSESVLNWIKGTVLSLTESCDIKLALGGVLATVQWQNDRRAARRYIDYGFAYGGDKFPAMAWNEGHAIAFMWPGDELPEPPIIGGIRYEWVKARVPRAFVKGIRDLFVRYHGQTALSPKSPWDDGRLDDVAILRPVLDGWYGEGNPRWAAAPEGAQCPAWWSGWKIEVPDLPSEE